MSKTYNTEDLKLLVDRYSKQLVKHINSYTDLVESRLQNDVGRCGPMSKTYNATVTSVCKRVLAPFNGFWASTGWCFIIFLPCLVFAMILTTLYRRMDPNYGPMMESRWEPVPPPSGAPPPKYTSRTHND